MAFFLRFKSQLRRTRPELVLRMEDTAIRTAQEAGGTISSGRGLVQAVFNENSPAFWLDMLLLIEKMIQAVNETNGELYGYSLLLGNDLTENPESLCCFLAGERSGSGVYLDRAAAEAMRPYLALEEPGEWASAKIRASLFCRVKEIKIFVQTAMAGFPLRETSANFFDAGQRQAILVYGRSFEGKRDELYRRFAGFTAAEGEENFPPLFVRFGNGGINALTDSWAAWMQAASAASLSSAAEGAKNDIAGLWEFLFMQRLKPEPSPFAVRTCRRFFELLLNLYGELANNEGVRPVVIFENIHAAEETAAGIAIEALRERHDFLLLGTCTGDIEGTELQKWKPLFPRVLKTQGDTPARPLLPDISVDLWETGYILSLFGRFFPPDLIPQLMQEAGKSPAVISRAISLLHALRIIDTPLDPQPWHADFFRNAEAALGERAKGLRKLVSGIVLAWVKRKKISPCIYLLESLSELGSIGEIDDNLILQSLYCELSWGDSTALENIRKGRTLETIAGTARAGVLDYIVQTMIAIHFGGEDNIHAAFSNTPPGCAAFPLLHAQVLLNQSLYHFSRHNSESALEAVKEATQLCQGKHSACLAHCYRIFALAALAQKRIGEAIDYLGFALENAAQHGSGYDIGISAYYASAVQLLHGNLTRAQALVEKGRRHFLKAGSPEWADRSRFLEGRILFETGHYRQAAGIFEEIRLGGDGGLSPEKNSLLEAWAFRAAIGGQHSSFANNGSGLDAELFSLEAMYLNDDQSRVEQLYASLPAADDRDTGTETDFLFTEQPDWHNGFAQCELLFFPHTNFRKRMAAAYHSLIHSRLFPAGGMEDLHTIQKVLRGGEFTEIDTCDIFYHFAWCRVLEQTDASPVDKSTAVSVAFKRLQSRAARIDDPETRRQYLSLPRWNKALAQAAAEFHLV